MSEKTTEELENILKKYNAENIGEFFDKNGKEMVSESLTFRNNFNDLMKEKGLKLRDLFIQADISESYGYKLISGQKHTQKRDVILRLCICMKCSLFETQHLLNLYGMQPLYARKKRDAILMIAVNDGQGSIYLVNELLEQYGEEQLYSCGEL